MFGTTHSRVGLQKPRRPRRRRVCCIVEYCRRQSLWGSHFCREHRPPATPVRPARDLAELATTVSGLIAANPESYAHCVCGHSRGKHAPGVPVCSRCFCTNFTAR